MIKPPMVFLFEVLEWGSALGMVRDKEYWQSAAKNGKKLGEHELTELVLLLDKEAHCFFSKRPILGGHKWFVVEAIRLSSGEIALIMEDGHIPHLAVINWSDKSIEMVWEDDV